MKTDTKKVCLSGSGMNNGLIVNSALLGEDVYETCSGLRAGLLKTGSPSHPLSHD